MLPYDRIVSFLQAGLRDQSVIVLKEALEAFPLEERPNGLFGHLGRLYELPSPKTR